MACYQLYLVHTLIWRLVVRFLGSLHHSIPAFEHLWSSSVNTWVGKQKDNDGGASKEAKVLLLRIRTAYLGRALSNAHGIYLRSFDHVHDCQLARTLYLLQTLDLHRQEHHHPRRYTA